MDFTKECLCVCVRVCERGKQKEGERSPLSDLFNYFYALFFAHCADEKGKLTVFQCATVAFQSRFICFPSALQKKKYNP